MAVLTMTNDEFKTFPPILKDYARYNVTIKGNSPKTICEYLQDLRTFFRFLIVRRDDLIITAEEFEKLAIADVGEKEVVSVTEAIIIEFFMYANLERHNSAATRMRKLSALRSFYHYVCTKLHIMENDPTQNVDAPKKGYTLPKYLTLEEAILLLETVRGDTESKTSVRDYCIISLFLNTGMRLSELVGLNIESLDPKITRVVVRGKGNKERVVYINDAAREALEDYLRIRLDPRRIRTAEPALFISGREKRISNKTVQWMVYKYLKLAGLGAKGLSVHKLRHTAATLMYQSGKVDIRVLKDILGHEQLNTTQIYTHIVERNIEEAVGNNPLAEITIEKPQIRRGEE